MVPHFSDHAANERTFLAWVRTVLAVVGFGLALARVGGQAPAPWSEAGLLIVGAVVVGLCFLRMRVLRRRIEAAEAEGDGSSLADGLLVASLAGVFLLMALFVVHVR